MVDGGHSHVRGIARFEATRWPAILAVLLCLAPVFATAIYPFVDFYPHMVRYYVLAHLNDSPGLQENYEAAWGLLPNLGMDLVGVGLMKALPSEAVGRIVVLLTVALPFCGVVYLARVLRGHVGIATLTLAGVVAFNHILIWGFANFLLGLGLALIGVGLWIELRGRPALQVGISAVIAVALLFVHGLTFGLWGLMLGFVELNHAIETRDMRLASLARRAGRLLLLAVIPTILFLQMPTSDVKGGITVSIDNLNEAVEDGRHWERLQAEVVNRVDSFLRVGDTGVWPEADWALGAALWGLLVFGLISGALKLDRRLLLAVAGAGLLVVVMPPNLFGSGYISDRMPVLLLCLLAASLSLRPEARFAQLVGLGLIALLTVRIALTAVGWAGEGRSFQQFQAAIAANDTGKLAVAVRFTEQRKGRLDEIRPRCTPLLSLLLLENQTAVRTFAFASQQPMRIIGPLAETQFAARHVKRPGGRADPASRNETISGLAAAGYDTVIACGGVETAEPPAGVVKLAGGEGWTLYRSQNAPVSRR